MDWAMAYMNRVIERWIDYSYASISIDNPIP